MKDTSIYESIAKRTGGDIYIGVVGPVRTGKSTFIRRFLDCVVLPNIESDNDRERALDEMPQSAGGRTVMTTEPKFVPDESVKISVGGTEFNVKMIDCVGYMVAGALGNEENGAPRMIRTPWREEAIPFSEAAEIGTSKVIGEHSTIGILVTTDGTIGDIPRENYIGAEERVAKELKALGKPFAIVLNSANPRAEEAHRLAEELEASYGAPVALVSCPDLSEADIQGILSLVLGEFPVRRLDFKMPDWTAALPERHPMRAEMLDKIREFAEGVSKLGDIEKMASEAVCVSRVDAGEGIGFMKLPIAEEEFFKTLGEMTGLDLSDKKKLFTLVCNMAEIKEKHERISDALREVEDRGYGIVMPTANELELDEPGIMKSASGYGVKLTARGESIHMIKTGIKADLCPVIGGEEQSAEVVKYLSEELSENKDKVWEYNMFGRSLYDMVSDSMTAKLEHMPDESREKLGDTLSKIINEGSNGLICILL